MSGLSARVQAFRDLHAAGCFVMPNPWDAGSARVLAQLGAALEGAGEGRVRTIN
jgi:methylisocitrate lyase